jgi:hypothetical protein
MFFFRLSLLNVKVTIVQTFHLIFLATPPKGKIHLVKLPLRKYVLHVIG